MALTRTGFRENPQRAIYIVGEINQATVDKLTPEIVALRAQSLEPITVYIDSPGGSTFHARLILNLLKSPTQDGDRLRIVTVVTGTAASAAADILAAGDYSIAYPHSLIHYHGVRTSSGDITHESASSLVEVLKQSNEGFALELAERIKRRFFFVYTQLASEFDGVRGSKANVSTVECFALCVGKKLSGSTKLLKVAIEKHQRLNSLLAEYNKELAKHKKPFARPADKEAFLIRFLVEWELQENSAPEWRFGSKGLNAIREDFVLLADFEDGQHMKDLDSDIQEWGMFLLSDTERVAYSELSGDDASAFVRAKVRESFRALWHFLVSVCRALQQGENRLTPYEAYWLGLVDEIPGSGLANLREIFERFTEAMEASKAKKRRKPTKRASQKTGNKPA